MQPLTLPKTNFEPSPSAGASSYPEVIVNHIRIATNAVGSGSIDIDGTDVAGYIRSFRLRAGVGEITELELDVHPRRAAEFEGDAYVRLQPEFEEFLTMLGWTPPRRP